MTKPKPKQRPAYILQAAGKANYDKTVSSPISISEYSESMGQDSVALREIFPGGSVRLYGLRPDGAGHFERLWKEILIGDVVLFSSKGLIRAKAEVVYKSRNPVLAESLWGISETGRSFELLYFLDNFEELNLPSSKFNEVVGYGPKFFVQSAFRLSDEKAESLRSFLETSKRTW